MEKLLVLTDLHMLEEGQQIIGLDPAARLRAVLDHACHHHGDATRIVLTGDLTHHGRPAQYDRLKQILADLPLPVSFLLGNHDNRAQFRATFPEAPCDGAGFVQSAFCCGGHRVICLDTLDPGSAPHHGGRLCPERLRWLERELTVSDLPVIVMQHHPPGPVGFDGMDAIALSNGAEELALLQHHAVRHLICGHIHRTISGQFGTMPFAIFKSPCHQMPMVLGAGQSSLSVDEPGAYGILLLSPQGIVVHSEDVDPSAGLSRNIATDQASA